MRRLLMSAVLVMAPVVLGAQSPTVAVVPQISNYTIGSGASQKTISQTAITGLVVVPILSNFNVDVATAFANSKVDSKDGASSNISGLTDTQLRMNWTVNDQFVFTLGGNGSSGQYSITQSKLDAAGQIGSDFLLFPVTTYGSGNSATLGAAFAKSFESFNLGIGASYRAGQEFTAFEVDSQSFKFQPANELRLRVGADRPIGDGRLALGATYSRFGKDKANNTTYSTGDRVIAQGSYYLPVGEHEFVLSGWDLFRMKGQQLGGDSPKENMLNGAASFGYHAGSVVLEPNGEFRYWTVDNVKAGMLGGLGARIRIPAGSWQTSVGGSYQMGSLFDTANTSNTTDVKGWRVSLMVRWN